VRDCCKGDDEQQHHTIAQGVSFSDAKDLREIRPQSPPTGHQMQVGWVKIGDFRQITGKRETHSFY